MKPIVIGILTAVLATTMLASGAQKTQDVERQLKAAMNTELVDGNLKAAIEQYKKLAQSGNRSLAAQALVRMAECYQKLGDAESRKIYERVVREFADQAESATTARTRLALLREPSAGPPAMTARRVWAGPEVDDSGAPSPDGRYLSYVDWETGDLAVRDLTTGEKRRLTNKGSWGGSADYAYFSAISPDSSRIAYSWWNNKETLWELRLLSLRGGPDGATPRVVFGNKDVSYFEPTGWSLDGAHVLVIVERRDRTSQLALISVTDGSMRALKTLDWRWPSAQFSPDGRYIVYDVPPKEDSPDRDIFVLATDGNRQTPLIEHPSDDFVLDWAPDGNRILFASNRTGTFGAWSIPVADGKPQGPPELVKGDVGQLLPLGFTRKGAFYYGVNTGLEDVYVATLDLATGKILERPAPATQRFMGTNSAAAWSPDGRHLAYLSRRGASQRYAGSRVLCIRSIETGQERELSPNLSEFFNVIRLRWSPDGRSLLASGIDNKGRNGLYRIEAQTGEVTPLVQGVSRFAQGVWSTDGKAIFYVHADANFENADIRVRDLETGRERELFRPASRSQLLNNMALSPDGRWLAFGSGTGSWEAEVLNVMPAAGGTPRELLKTNQDVEGVISAVEWTPDGSQLLFSRRGDLWRISAQGGQPQKLGLGVPTPHHGSSLSIHPDGRRIAFAAGERQSEVWVMENLLPLLKPVR